jgi:1-aminocyclopropane-1-carboxylate deaminase/D-cysteine desulfhydrase-like pyridoxal-dependent ACC family enzyme
MSDWLDPDTVERPLSLSKINTDLEFRPDISARLGKPLFIKREDEADALGCGHKLRKLSFLMPGLVRAGVNVLVTVGSLPSNQCKAVARAAQVAGIKAHLVYLGDNQERPAIAHGNYRLTSLLGAEVTWCDRTPWAHADTVLGAIVQQETDAGRKPALLPSGLSQAEGLLASVEMGYEIDEALGEDRYRRVGIVAAAGSGGTCLGVKLAGERLGRDWHVFGCLIGETVEKVYARVMELRKTFVARFGGESMLNNNFNIIAEAIGNGYNKSTVEEMETMSRVAREFGILFDLNYMTKTYLALEKLNYAGHFDNLDVIVLVHSGGQIGLFDENRDFTSWHQKAYHNWTASRKSINQESNLSPERT